MPTHRLISIVSAIGYFLVLFLGYQLLLIPIYGYVGFEFKPIDFNWILSLVFVVVPAFFLSNKDKVSSFVHQYVYYVIFVPLFFSSYYAAEFYLSSHDVLRMIIVVSLLFSCYLFLYPFISEAEFIPIKKINFNVYPLCLVFAGACFVYFFITSFSNFNPGNIYSVHDLSDVRINANTGYLGLWMLAAMFPFLLANSGQRWILVKQVLLFLVYLYFGIAFGAKIWFVAPLFVVWIYWSSYKSIRWTYYCFPLILSVLILFPLLLNGSVKNFTVGIILFRSIAIPAFGYPVYFDYFKHNSFELYRDFLPVRMIISSELKPLPIRLDNIYGLGNYNAHFILSDGYANLGVLGIVISFFQLFVIVKVIDFISQEYDARRVLISISVVLLFMANVSLFTLVSSYGLVLVCVLYMFKKN